MRSVRDTGRASRTDCSSKTRRGLDLHHPRTAAARADGLFIGLVFGFHILILVGRATIARRAPFAPLLRARARGGPPLFAYLFRLADDLALGELGEQPGGLLLLVERLLQQLCLALFAHLACPCAHTAITGDFVMLDVLRRGDQPR